MPLGRLPGEVVNRLTRGSLDLGHPVDVLEDVGVAAAGRVAVDVADAVARQVEREGVRVPGRAGVAAVRVARPPGDPDAARQLVAVLAEHPCSLEQRRVAGRVVADADVPGVEMAVQEHEPLRLVRPLELGDEHRNRAPALLVLRDDGRGRGAGGDLLEQPAPVRSRDGDDRDLRLAREARQVGRAPDRGADPLVDPLARRDEDRSQRAAGLEVGDLARHRQALGDDELAGDIALARDAREDVVDRGSVGARRVDDRAALALRRRRARHARRLGEVARTVDDERRASRQADQQLRLVERVRDVPGLELLDDQLDRLPLLLGSRLPHKFAECLDERPGIVEPNVVDHLLLTRDRQSRSHDGFPPSVD